MSAINVGDLVVVVKPTPCCNRSDSVGRLFIVTYIGSIFDRPCTYCRVERANACVEADGTNRWFDQYRVKRIPPLEELDEVKKDEEIHV